MSQKYLPSPTGQASRTGQCKIAVSEPIVPTAREREFSEWKLSQNYRCTLVDNSKQTGHKIQLLFLLEYTPPLPSKTNHCHPIYRHTRSVTVSNEPDTTLFTNLRHQSVDVNPKSTTALDERVTSTLFPTTSGQMLNLKMSARAISKLTAYPVFNMANEQVKDNHAANILLTAQYKAYEDMLRYNNEGKTERE